MTHVYIARNCVELGSQDEQVYRVCQAKWVLGGKERHQRQRRANLSDAGVCALSGSARTMSLSA